MRSKYFSRSLKWIAVSLCAVGSFQLAFAGLPPTTSKDSTDTGPVTTFHFEFPNFTGTHTGTTFSLGVNSIAGGGTGQTTASAAFTALLPSFTAGSVIFSDGTTLVQDNANFFYDSSLARLDIGNPGGVSGDLTARIRNQWTAANPADNLLTNNFNSINYTITDDSATNLLNTESQLVFAVAAGKSNFAFTANHYSLIGRGDGGDEGYVGFTANYLGSITHGGSALKHTGLYAAFMHGFDSIGSDGLIDNMYDFYAQGGSPGAGAITNRYGIVIEPDSGYTKSNWLSGKTQIGGSSFSVPTDIFHVDGDMSATKSVTDTVAVAGLFSATTDTTVDNSDNTQGLQTSVIAKVQSGATNDKVAAGLINTVVRGDGTDDGTLDTLNGVTSLLFHNPGSSGVTNKGYGYASIMITQQGTLTDYYDFYSERAPAGGTLTNHWGVYIKDDSTTPVKNYLSGQTKLGGSSFTATSDTLYIDGDATMGGVWHSTDTNESLDLNSRHLIKNGINVVDYDSDKLTDDNGDDSVFWKTRILNSSSSGTILEWSGDSAKTPQGTQLNTSGTQPTCDVAHRGLIWNVEGALGVADLFQICQKTALNTYSWTTH